MYKVTCLYGGTTYTLHDPLSEELRIYDDEMVTETNAPGSFRFTVSCDHPYLSKIKGLASDIRVYDGAEEIWRGRPIDDGEDLYRARTFKCEGELAFLYDSIQPRRELHNVTPYEFLELLLNEHNRQVGTVDENEQVSGTDPIDKTFRVGTVTVTDPNNSLYRYTNRETTFFCIEDKILDRLGGHLRVRVENGVRYLDLLAEVDTVIDQPVQLGENLLDYASNTDYTTVATACIPLGAALEETEIEALDAYLTCAEANNGSETLQIAEAVQQYGFICKVVHFDDITLPSNLKARGERWLTDGQYETLTLELAAVDLHTLGYDVQPIRINMKVRVVSSPHGMDRYFPVTKRTYHLTQPEADTVTFGGTERKRSYTSSNSKQVSTVMQHAEQLRQNIDVRLVEERANVASILNQATHGYVVLDPNSGPERILIMDTNDPDTAQKIWKWDLNGLSYSGDGGNTYGIAITMNGEICADYILTGALDAGIITAGTLQDTAGKNFWNMETGEFSLSADTTVGENGDTIDDIAADWAYYAVGSQTQQEVFNILTNNGQTQGIYLSGGRLYINADYIQAGTLDANYISLSGSSGGFSTGYGSDGVNVTTGAMMYGSGDPYIIVTEAGCRMQGTGADFYVTNSAIVASEEIAVTSDRRVKNSMDYDMSRYEQFYMALKPVSFRKNNGTSGRTHTGFIAQDVERALLENGLSTTDFAGLTIEQLADGFTKDGVSDQFYQLRYGEFISLNTHMIQQLCRRVEALEAKNE